MQKLDVEILKQANKMKIKEMDEKFIGVNEGMNLCPECQYVGSYSPKGSLKVFEDGSAKCFSCGIWRKIREMKE